MLPKTTMGRVQALAEFAGVPMTRMFEALVELAMSSPGVQRRLRPAIADVMTAEHTADEADSHRTTVVLARRTYGQLMDRAFELHINVRTLLDVLLDLSLGIKGLCQAAVPLAQQINVEYRDGSR